MYFASGYCESSSNFAKKNTYMALFITHLGYILQIEGFVLCVDAIYIDIKR